MGAKIRAALMCAIACCAVAALAQPAVSPGDGTNALGSGKSRGKLLTRDELRACMATQARHKSERAALTQREKALDKDKAEILAEGEAIAAARDALDRTSEDAIKAFNERVLARDARIDDYNKRNAALVADATAWQAASDQWKTQCGDRRYREDDEIAIKRGK
jgi:hypothetical protein